MNYSRDDVSAAIAAMEKFRRPDDDDNSVIPASVEIDPFIHPRDSAQAA